jgi:hypothetical protein
LIIAATIALAVAMSLPVIGAFGKAERASSRISLANDQARTYRGLVESSNPRCFARRSVTVFHDENRNGIDGKDYVIGQDLTATSGFYKVVGAQAPAGDRIIARVLRRKRGSLVCKGDLVQATALD